MFKFFDREGNTLVLRPDVTPSIARCIAKYFNEENMGIRLSYAGNVFLNNSSYQLKLKETCQLGAELVNERLYRQIQNLLQWQLIVFWQLD